MRAVVVGGGAWGLPAAAELVRRGHAVTLVDQHGPANPYGSSHGASRLWRLSHPDRVRVRLAQRAVAAWQRLESRTGAELLLRRGLLWRDAGSVEHVAAALAAEGVAHLVVDPEDVARFLPGLRPTGVSAVWQADAGPVLAERALAAQLAAVTGGAGAVVSGPRVVDVETRAGSGVVVRSDDGESWPADVAVLAPGPGAVELLPVLGVELALEPVLEQVTYLAGRPGWIDLACWYEGEREARPGLYAMPTPGLGYKVGIDRPLRRLDQGDLDRTPDPGIEAAIVRRVSDDLCGTGSLVEPTATSSQVCSWTDSPDGRFVLDRLHDSRVVVACGDSGEGFKFSALMGELLADLAEGAEPDADVASYGLAVRISWIFWRRAVFSNGGLDANWLVKHGLPTVSFGAGQNEVHTVKEFVDLPEFAVGCRLAVALATLES